MSTFQSTIKDTVPVLTPFKTVEQPTKLRCAILCQQEVDCVTFTARPLPTGRVTCLMYDSRPLKFDHQLEDGVVTMMLVKTIYV